MDIHDKFLDLMRLDAKTREGFSKLQQQQYENYLKAENVPLDLNAERLFKDGLFCGFALGLMTIEEPEKIKYIHETHKLLTEHIFKETVKKFDEVAKLLKLRV